MLAKYLLYAHWRILRETCVTKVKWQRTISVQFDQEGKQDKSGRH
jgi:hypothetical protein